jgi:hypothetical protein
VWKASDGGWYLDLAYHEYGGPEDAYTFGPFSDDQAASAYLSRNFASPGNYSVNSKGRKPPPTVSPNGFKVQEPPPVSPGTGAVFNRSPAASLQKKHAPVVSPAKTPRDKTTHKIYGKKAGASVHTRLKGKPFIPSGTSMFKNGSRASLQLDPDGKLTVTDPATGHTQSWNSTTESINMKKLDAKLLRKIIRETLEDFEKMGLERPDVEQFHNVARADRAAALARGKATAARFAAAGIPFGDEPGAEPAPVAAPRAPEPTKPKKDLYKVYGKKGEAPVHTRFKGKPYVPSQRSRFSSGDRVALDVDADNKLSVKDPTSGHTQTWDSANESFERVMGKLLDK